MQAPHLCGGEFARRPMRVDPRAPERLVDVDVSHPGQRALVEQRRLDRGAAAGQAPAELCGREFVRERLRTEALVEVGVELSGLEQQPGSEAPDVAIRNVRSVV